jgi:hypothetical protein
MGTRKGIRKSSLVANSQNKLNLVGIGNRTSQRQLYYDRRQITLHSLRRWVKSTISDLWYGEYPEYFLGHASVSTYYRKTAHDNCLLTIPTNTEKQIMELESAVIEKEKEERAAKPNEQVSNNP